MTVTQPIPGHFGYHATTDGVIIGRTGRPLTPHDIGGYQRVGVIDDLGVAKHVMVHRLIAVTFLGPAPSGHQVNHIDGIKAHNAVTNLEYVTPAANVRHSIDVLGAERAPGEANGNAVLTNGDVIAMRALHAEGVTAAAIGRQFGIDVSHAWRVCTRRSWMHL